MAAEEQQLDLSGGQIAFPSDPIVGDGGSDQVIIGECTVCVDFEEACDTVLIPRVVCLHSITGTDEDGDHHAPQFEADGIRRTSEEVLNLPGNPYGSPVPVPGGLSTCRFPREVRTCFSTPVKKINLVCYNLLMRNDGLCAWRYVGGDLAWPYSEDGSLPTNEPWAARALEKFAAPTV